MKSNREFRRMGRMSFILIPLLSIGALVFASTSIDAQVRTVKAGITDRGGPKTDNDKELKARQAAAEALKRTAKELKNDHPNDAGLAGDADDIAKRLTKKKGEEGYIDLGEALLRVKNLEEKIQKDKGLKEEEKKKALNGVKDARKALGDKGK